MQQWEVTYWEFYFPFVHLISIFTLIEVASIHELHVRSIDFVISFPQAELDIDIFTETTFIIDIVFVYGG